jgi:hypothetical protein
MKVSFEFVRKGSLGPSEVEFTVVITSVFGSKLPGLEIMKGPKVAQLGASDG